jgi:hypothetical protein
MVLSVALRGENGQSGRKSGADFQAPYAIALRGARARVKRRTEEVVSPALRKCVITGLSAVGLSLVLGFAGTTTATASTPNTFSVTQNVYDGPTFWGTITFVNDGPAAATAYMVQFDVPAGANCTAEPESVPVGATLTPLVGSAPPHTPTNHCIFIWSNTASLGVGQSKTFNYSTDLQQNFQAANLSITDLTPPPKCFIAFIHGSGNKAQFGDLPDPANPNHDLDDPICGNSEEKFIPGPTDWLGPRDAPLPDGWDLATMGDPRIPGKLEGYWSPNTWEDQTLTPRTDETVKAEQAQGEQLASDFNTYSLTGAASRVVPDWTLARLPFGNLLGLFWFISAQVAPQSVTSQQCVYFRISYNGLVEWWHDAAAGLAARRLAEALDRYNVPDGKLVIVTHSMGGLVARHILNHGTPNSMFFNEAFGRVARATRHLYTIQAPHAGSTAADASMGTTDVNYVNEAAAVVNYFRIGDLCKDRRVASLATGHIRNRIADGTMGDEGRTATIMSIGGYCSEGHCGQGYEDDFLTSIASQAVCYESGFANLSGGFCGRLPCWRPTYIDILESVVGQGGGLLPIVAAATCTINSINFRPYGGFDGLVDTCAAHGWYPPSVISRSSRALRIPQPGLGGPHIELISAGVNHHQGRMNVWKVKDMPYMPGDPTHFPAGYFFEQPNSVNLLPTQGRFGAVLGMYISEISDPVDDGLNDHNTSPWAIPR